MLNWEKVKQVAEDPLHNLWWTEADKPWSFLAWCFEWVEGCLNPQFVSHLPIALDGSCNGIQHFSAMLRDPIGRAAVNLIDQDLPQDIYGKVAARVLERLAEVPDTDETYWMAQTWQVWGIDRKVTKRAVMVLPYGGTFHSCLQYVREAVQDKIAGGHPNPFGDELPRATTMLSSHVWAAISDVVVGARTVMGWLQEVARTTAKAGVPLEWTAPSGFQVYQDYRKVKERRIKTQFNGALVYMSLLNETDTLDPYKQSLAVSPNFVHALDATALMRTLRLARAEGLSAFSMIHDSYGVHAADTDRLAALLREAFVGLYEEHDVLEEFREQVVASLPEAVAEKIPPIPPKGSLDIREVLKSRYFFA
jgi:DNA-directed RNA polymerase